MNDRVDATTADTELLGESNHREELPFVADALRDLVVDPSERPLTVGGVGDWFEVTGVAALLVLTDDVIEFHPLGDGSIHGLPTQDMAVQRFATPSDDATTRAVARTLPQPTPGIGVDDDNGFVLSIPRGDNIGEHGDLHRCATAPVLPTRGAISLPRS
jgi:hypothetical protein